MGEWEGEVSSYGEESAWGDGGVEEGVGVDLVYRGGVRVFTVGKGCMIGMERINTYYST